MWEHRWTLGPLETAALLAGGIAFWAVLEFTERATLGAARRVALTTLRVVAWLALLFMLAQWNFSRQHVERPTLAIVIDDSQSMATVDQADESASSPRRRRATVAGFSDPTRFALAQTLLKERDAALWKSLTDRYRPEVFLLSETLTALDSGSRDDDDASERTDANEPLARLKLTEPYGRSSRLGAGISQLLDERRGNPPAAILLFSDGVVTAGPTLGEIAPFARAPEYRCFVSESATTFPFATSTYATCCSKRTPGSMNT
ncbi:MAG: hypothetical protein QM811_26665 [Pirellulales bacterium]